LKDFNRLFPHFLQQNNRNLTKGFKENWLMKWVMMRCPLCSSTLTSLKLLKHQKYVWGEKKVWSWNGHLVSLMRFIN